MRGKCVTHIRLGFIPKLVSSFFTNSFMSMVFFWVDSRYGKLFLSEMCCLVCNLVYNMYFYLFVKKCHLSFFA